MTRAFESEQPSLGFYTDSTSSPLGPSFANALSSQRSNPSQPDGNMNSKLTFLFRAPLLAMMTKNPCSTSENT